jgi:hypothetical protein
LFGFLSFKVKKLNFWINNLNQKNYLEKQGIICDWFSFITSSIGVIFSILSFKFINYEYQTILFTWLCIIFDSISVIFAFGGFYFGFKGIFYPKKVLFSLHNLLFKNNKI